MQSLYYSSIAETSQTDSYAAEDKSLAKSHRDILVMPMILKICHLKKKSNNWWLRKKGSSYLWTVTLTPIR